VCTHAAQKSLVTAIEELNASAGSPIANHDGEGNLQHDEDADE
jgi:hypothetical protein